MVFHKLFFYISNWRHCFFGAFEKPARQDLNALPRYFLGAVSFLILMSPIHASTEKFDQTEVSQFLEIIVSTEPSEWDKMVKTWPTRFPQWAQKSTLCKLLNELNPFIFKQDNLSLIHLFQRALRNHDELSSEKADPFVFYYKHYQPASFLVPKIDLTIDVQGDLVLVSSHLTIHRNSLDKELVLDGRDHKVLSVFVNDQLLPRKDYRVTPNELIIFNVPDGISFTVTVKSEINPFENGSFEGLYQSGEFLTTQCESEGARRIFFTLDRPDVLSQITTTLIADPKKYPFRLSNGNLLEENSLSDGRSKIIWEDPIPKPSYLFACVMGDLAKLEDQFVTMNGKKVALEVYVGKGKEARGFYGLEMLKEAMKFDEQFFDREYDLDCLKIVAIPDFNAGAMENKGLMIFNERAFLVDRYSGTDDDFRLVASVVAHEYFHNWSGNRVTVRNWFELALKEAFTDFRAMLFGEWVFGLAFSRPEDVTDLRERQFPEETSERGHPIMVESYVNARSIYDHTTYIKGREVFRALQTYMDMMLPEGFRKAQNLYFDRYDGQAVTFRELLQAASDVLFEHKGETLGSFERWFHQQGTPQVAAEIRALPEKKQLELKITQSCPHPKTRSPQKPLLIPFTYEFLREDGSVAIPKQTFVFSEESHVFQIEAEEKLIPLFMHNYGAPIILKYDYSLEELACLMHHASDPFIQWEAGQTLSLLLLEKALLKYREDGDSSDFTHLFVPYSQALQSQKLSPLAKAQLLDLPSLRAMAQKYDDYDFVELKKVKTLFAKQLALACKPLLQNLLEQYRAPKDWAPTQFQMEIRKLRSACWNLLASIDVNFMERVYENYYSADNFHMTLSAFNTLTDQENSFREEVVRSFYLQWKEDKTVFNYWLRGQSGASCCKVSDLKKLIQVDGYDEKNPNHIRSVLATFVLNLDRYHDPKGEGYAFLVDQILSIGKSNSYVSHGLTLLACTDFAKLPEKQQKLMAKEFSRLQDPEAPPETRDFIKKTFGL
jgi:aminopeptidase N